MLYQLSYAIECGILAQICLISHKPIPTPPLNPTPTFTPESQHYIITSLAH
ncbi:hypothetical protein [uncultured Helicobacter sp.]|uniref:hypothetical protein n=1 Tax=uncultured Helicobacter sp. TaxID=175537 RepID=UPI0026253628|nr:hypothetical protein [uncultured Helicobacter sp.]